MGAWQWCLTAGSIPVRSTLGLVWRHPTPEGLGAHLISCYYGDMSVHYLFLPQDPGEAHRVLSDHIGRYFPNRHEAILIDAGSATTRQLLNSMIRNKGFSVHDYMGDVPRTGYMVALEGHEEKYPLSELEGTPDILQSYRDDHASVIGQPNHFLGGWLNHEGWGVLDISEWVPTLPQAIEVGHQRNQTAVYDLAAGKAIDIRNLSGRVYSRNATIWEDQIHAMAQEFYANGGIDPPEDTSPARQRARARIAKLAADTTTHGQ
jgi:hypothetical protein